MRHLLARLNDLLAQGPEQGDANKNLKQLLIMYARNPAKANIFNYASMAHNHHFFMSTLSQTPGVVMPEQLRENLDRCFSSVHTLRETFIDIANAMFGPGYVWLVLQWNPSPHALNLANRPERASTAIASGYGGQTENKNKAPSYEFRILPTYLAGSPYPGAHARQQAHNLTNHNLETYREEMAKNAAQRPANQVGYFGPYSRGDTGDAADGTVESIKRWSGADIMPVMCVSTWQHAYMQDWGIDGKKQFLEAWWERIDWEKVWANAGVAARSRG